MAGNEDTKLVDSGPNHEIWKGPAGSMRLDWNKRGAIRIIVKGHGYAGYALPTVRKYDEALRGSMTKKVIPIFDFWDMEAYDSALRVETQGWGSKHRAEMESVYLLTRSKLVSMGASVANLAIGGLMKIFTRKEEFDREVQKLGLPINPSMG